MDIPSISDDVLQCIVHPLKGDDPAVLATQIMSYVQDTLPNHIWHRDSFELILSKESEGALECTMRVGDSIDDEWLVVWLLWQVTKKFPVAASVYDADGQFLLIEAAEKLPVWVTPERVENRVWIYEGHLHIVPLSCRSATSTKHDRRSRLNAPDADYNAIVLDSAPYISISDALDAVQNPSIETQAAKEVEDIILARISEYPSAAKSQVHRAKVALPTDIARALATNPSLIQKAVECFYTRDPAQLRATQRMTRFPPTSSSVVTVRMTKTAYAQLMGQRFNAPRVFRRPLDQSEDEARWWDNGVKIACGFEMLYQEARTRKEGIHGSRLDEMDKARLEALRRDASFANYLAKLEYTDYFEGEIRDSKRWKEKEMQAAKAWITMRQADDASRPSFADQVNAALKSNPDTVLRDEGEDPDDWIHVEPMDIERSLGRYSQQVDQPIENTGVNNDGQKTEEDRVTNEQASKLKNLADKMEGFVEGEGALEGAVFEDDILSDDEDDEDLDSEHEKVKRKAAMDALVAPLEPGEYGRMPVEYRHPNTQMTALSSEPQQDRASDEAPPKKQKAEEPLRPLRKPILLRDKFDGVDSDDETTDDEGGFIEDEETGEDQPQVVGEVEIDMEQEQEDFIRFSREMLGIDDEIWANIVADRQKRGAYVPSLTSSKPREESIKPKSGPNAAQFFDAIPELAVKPKLQRSTTKTGEKNPDLDSFDAVMEAMEKELERLKVPRASKGVAAPGVPTYDVKGKGKGRQDLSEDLEMYEVGEDQEMLELQQAMDAELKSSLKKDTEVVSSEDEEEVSEEETPMDYNLIKNFLESFKSQAGLGGPVGGLAGRLQGSDWALPRDG